MDADLRKIGLGFVPPEIIPFKILCWLGHLHVRAAFIMKDQVRLEHMALFFYKKDNNLTPHYVLSWTAHSRPGPRPGRSVP